MNGSAASFIKRIERSLGVITRSDAEEVDRLIGMIPILWSTLAQYPKAQRAVRDRLLELVRDPYVTREKPRDREMLFGIMMPSLHGLLKKHYPTAFEVVDAAIAKEMAR
jgi:hypothetical protein